MKSGTIFDNVLICDDEEYAQEFGDETWGETKGPEKEMKDAVRLRPEPNVFALLCVFVCVNV